MAAQARFRGVSKFLSGREADRIRCALEVRRAWGQWLSIFVWHHFATLTFACQPSVVGATRDFRTWVRRLEQRAQERVFWFYVLERGAAGQLHVHALVSGTRQLQAASFKDAWSWGRADASAYNRHRGAAYYVSKCLASHLVEYDVNLPPCPPTTDAGRPTPSSAGESSARRTQPCRSAKESP